MAAKPGQVLVLKAQRSRKVKADVTMPCVIVHIGIMLILYTTVAAAAPVSQYNRTYQEIARPRIFYSALGDILETLTFLPVTINVPDVITGAWTYISGWLPWFSGATGTRRPATTEAGPSRQEILDYILY